MLPTVADERMQLLSSSETLQPAEEDDRVSSFERFLPTQDKLKSYQAFITDQNTCKTGYCLMLDYTKISDDFLESCPQVFNYIEQVFFLIQNIYYYKFITKY